MFSKSSTESVHDKESSFERVFNTSRVSRPPFWIRNACSRLLKSDSLVIALVESCTPVTSASLSGDARTPSARLGNNRESPKLPEPDVNTAHVLSDVVVGRTGEAPRVAFVAAEGGIPDSWGTPLDETKLRSNPGFL